MAITTIIEARVIQKVATEQEWNETDLLLYQGEAAYVSDKFNFKLNTQEEPKRFSELEYYYKGDVVGTVNTTQDLSLVSDGVYYAQTSGTYAGVVVREGYYVLLRKSGGVWSIATEVKMPEPSITGVVEAGNPNAVSGGEVFNKTMLEQKYVFKGEVAKGKNLFDKRQVTINKWLNTTTGAIENVLTSHSISDYIPVKRDVPYILSGGYGSGSGNTRISIFENVGDTIPVQYVTMESLVTPITNGFAVIMTASATSTRVDTIQFEEGTIDTPYEAFIGEEVEEIYLKYLPKDLQNVNLGGQVAQDDLRLVNGDTVYNAIQPLNEITTRSNFFNKETVVYNQMLNVDANTPAGMVTLASVPNWGRTNTIKLEKGDYKILGITIGQNAMFAGLFDTENPSLNTNGVRILNNNVSITTDEPKYLIFSIKSTSFTADLNVIQVKRLSDTNEYVSYNEIFVNPDKILQENDIDTSKDLSVLIQPTEVRVRSNYSETQDLVQIYQYQNFPTTNGVFSGKSIHLVPKSIALTADLSTYLVQDINDSISPMGTDQYWFIAGQHGFPIARLTSSGNTFTIGQDVKDQDSREYKVIHKDATYLYLNPKITVSGTTITRSWTSTSQPITSLSTIDGSYTNPTTSLSRYQLKPMMTKVIQKILIDGKEMTEQGLFNADSVELVDVFNVVNPIGATFNGISGMTGNSLMEITQSYYFKGNSVYLSSNLNMNDFLPFIKYHGIQPLGLMPSGGYVPYAIYPKVKPQTATGKTNVDWNYPTDISSTTTPYAKYLFANNSTDLEVVDDLTDRTIQYLKNDANDYKFGFGAGLDLENGLTSKENRKNYAGQAFELIPSVNNKTYFRVLTSDKFTDGVLPSTFIGQFNTYFSYFKPSANIQSYVVHTKDTSYIYIHTQALFNKNAVLVDNIEGKQLEVVEVKGIELLTDRVVNGKLFIKTSNANANYIVLKTK